MSSESNRDFSNFELGDNVFKLADYLVPHVAELLEVELSEQPDSGEIQDLLDGMRTNKVLRNNEPIVAIDHQTKLDLVERSGIQKPLDRSLWTPSVKATEAADVYLMVTAVANWQDRAAAVVENSPKKPVYIAAGNREMKQPTEVTNPNVQAIFEATGSYPTEAAYAAKVILPRLVESGFDEVHLSTYQTGDGDEIAERFYAGNPYLTDRRIAVVRNANAGLITAIQHRTAARKVGPTFDIYAHDAQLMVVTDGLPLARTPEQEADAAHYQKVDPAFGQMLLLAKKLASITAGTRD